MVKYFKKFTLNDLIASIEDLYKSKKEPQYQIIGNEKIFKLIDIAFKQHAGLISKRQADLETRAELNNAYICPTWDYLKYPEINLYKSMYSIPITNESFEITGQDEYGDDILIYAGQNMKTLKFELFLNGHPLAGIQETLPENLSFDVQRLFNVFKQQVDNILENGYYKDGKLKDIINSNKFNGYD